MIFNDKLNKPGEHAFVFQGAAGQLEGVLTVPENDEGHYIALLGHPHSLQGGTMNNKVVTTLARAFKELGLPSLRFNFRGVGASEGVYDAGIGESEDLLILANRCHQELPARRFIFAGFSFGSYVSYRAATQFDVDLLLSVAPPVHHYNYAELPPRTASWVILQGDEDEVVPAEEVYRFAAALTPPLPVHRFADTGHFFHGKLLELKSVVIAAARERISSL